MISLQDCVALSGLTEEEVLAIAENQQMTETCACGLAQYLSQTQGGLDRVRDMIVADLRRAQDHHNRDHARELLHVLHHFLRSHPESRPSVHPWSAVF